MSLLAGKVLVPGRRRGVVGRGRLGERLALGVESLVTLVSAPAGFGKTTLLTEWLAAGGQVAAWLSLDERDNDPGMFWAYLVKALKSAAPAVGESALSLLQSPKPPIEAVLSALLNDLSAVEYDVVLVLDDYHVIEADEIHGGMTFLVDHLPPRIHLVISTRIDPALPLARLRARGELVEIRSAELRFTADEVAAYLNGVMGLRLTVEDVAVLDERTEGWIAALQLAALSMQGRDDASGFIAGFAGDDRHLVDYLAEEVLLRQPEAVQDFLLRTSILDRLCGPLCDAVTGQEGGKDRLAALERANLFLFPLDDQRRWYRYHQLFAEDLQARLLDEQPEAAAGLHQRASAWYEHNGEPAEAIRHAFAAKDFGRAADLIELAIPALRRTRNEAVVRGWLKLLPDEVVRVRPVLCVMYAGTLLITGELDDVERWLRDAERWLHPTPADDEVRVVVDHEEFARLLESIETYRAAQALGRGDLPGTVGHGRRALALAPEESYLWRSAAAGLLGLAFWATGDLDAAHQAWSDCTAGLQRAGYTADALGCAIALADIRLAQGRPSDAMRTYEQALLLKPEQGQQLPRGTADMYVGLSDLHRERNDLRTATQYLAKSQELGEHAGLAQYSYRRRVAMARIRQAEGDLAAAVDLLNEAERVYVSDYFPNVRPIPALRARVWIASGELNAALGWVREQGLTIDDELSYLREFEHLTLARLLLTQASPVEAFLQRLLQAAEEGKRTGSVIEILVLQALAHRSLGHNAAAFASLQRALTLAEPDRHVRIFIDEGPPMTTMLRTLAKQGSVPAQTLLRTDPGTPVKQGLIEPLSAREFDVLRLLGTDLDGPGIARELIVSLNTVRTHTKHIYAKLGVNNRRAAVRRATELDLFSR
ncbi:LuxR C-terminal-related transcriptional regulator [Kribbella catacumbae]|uniref:LuxR C-terminal-related transcriptional regulator n=1 Tax=Kribbella catacumbae TaxID=460086 RepID=UPI00037D163D|nr:LuxR C-terminal-related transcriptional regulator [Kribbella catacumbae]